MRSLWPRPRSPRRGVTLVEMLVTVALLVLMMSVIATIFQAATGAVTTQRTLQELDGNIRNLDSMIRQDLLGVTAKMTPPNDPDWQMGYFEYGENSFADNQGEDVDDYLKFTAKAPEGKFFTGRMYLAPPIAISAMSAAQLNAYLATQPITIYSQFAEIVYFVRNGNLYRRVFLVVPERAKAMALGTGTGGAFTSVPALGNQTISWQGVNDISAHPSPTGGVAKSFLPPIPNTMGDLTNRENRVFSPRYANDYVTNFTNAVGPDNVPDDENTDSTGTVFVGDGIPDLLKTFYPEIGTSSPSLISSQYVNAPVAYWKSFLQFTSFPYIYQGAYSQPDVSGAGWIHLLDPSGTTFNQNPLMAGDNLAIPSGATELQTWWGFPLWRETLSPNWMDPLWQPNVNSGNQALGLRPFAANAVPASGNANLLPPTGDPFADGAGSASFVLAGNQFVPWQDDLIMTGVRSFDVKAYDDAFPGYVDLGWGDDTRLPTLLPTSASDNVGGTSFLSATPVATIVRGATFPTLQTFAHEGRIPPLQNDLRPDAQFPTLSTNIGDNQATVMRLRRVWDSWSTDYTQTPATGIDSVTNLPIGPPFGPPIFPSYPAPYPQALRGIQIQIRVVDPRNERVKSLTIRQDFSDNL